MLCQGPEPVSPSGGVEHRSPGGFVPVQYPGIVTREPGATRSGLRRPSHVGPRLLLPTMRCSEELQLPTRIPFLVSPRSSEKNPYVSVLVAPGAVVPLSEPPSLPAEYTCGRAGISTPSSVVASPRIIESRWAALAE